MLAGPQPLVDLLWGHELAAVPLDTPEARAGLRRRLSDHTATIADTGRARAIWRGVPPPLRCAVRHRRRPAAVRAAPRPAARSAPASAPAPPVRPTSDNARSIGSGGIDRTMARAIVAGLLLHPAVVAAQAETLAGLSLGDPLLERIRDLLVDAAFAGARP